SQSIMQEYSAAECCGSRGLSGANGDDTHVITAIHRAQIPREIRIIDHRAAKFGLRSFPARSPVPAWHYQHEDSKIRLSPTIWEDARLQGGLGRLLCAGQHDQGISATRAEILSNILSIRGLMFLRIAKTISSLSQWNSEPLQ